MKKFYILSLFLAGAVLSAAPWSANGDFKQLDTEAMSARQKKSMESRGIVFSGEQTPAKWSFACYGRKAQSLSVVFKAGVLEVKTQKDTLTLHNLRLLSVEKFKSVGTHRFYASGKGNMLVKCSLLQYDKAGKYVGSVNLGAFHLNSGKTSAEITVDASKVKFSEKAAKAAATFGLVGEGVLTGLGVEIKK